MCEFIPVATDKHQLKNIMKNIQSHKNAAGENYFSGINDEGQTVYSFNEFFDDIWTQEDEHAESEGSTPAKF